MFSSFCSKNNPKTIPRRPQDGSKMDLVSEAVLEPIFDHILTPSWSHFLVIFGVDFGINFGCYTFWCFKRMHGETDARGPLLGASWDRSWSDLDPRRGARTLRILDEIEDAPFPSASRLQDHFGAILAPSWPLLTSPTNCSETSKSVKIGPRGPFSAIKKNNEKENSAHVCGQSREAQKHCKNWWFLKILIV